MAGTYTIGGASPDFADIQAAVDALHSYGICSDVTFKIRDGIYNEQVELNEFVDSGQSMSVNFEAETPSTKGVKWEYQNSSEDSDFVLMLKGTNNVRFRHITFNSARGDYTGLVLGDGHLNNISFEHCIFQVDTVISSSSSDHYSIYLKGDLNGISFKNNVINGNYYGLSILPNYGNYVSLEDNRFSGQQQMAISVARTGNLLVSGNYMANAGWGMSLSQLLDSVVVKNNQVYVNGNIGIFLRQLKKNSLTMFNNFIVIDGYFAVARGLFIQDSWGLNIYHNSIVMGMTGSGASSAVELDNVRELNFLNNIVSGKEGAYVYVIENNCQDLFFDHNALYSKNNYVNLKGVKIFSNFNEWQGYQIGSQQQDMNSVDVLPDFVSITDLHLINDSGVGGMGIPVGIVANDIDGESRDILMPDIGADEVNDKSQVDAGIYKVEIQGNKYCEGNRTLTAVIKNYGIDTLTTLTIEWKVNQVNQTTAQWNGKLSPNDTASIFLDTLNIAQDSGYDFSVWTTMPNGVADSVASNDSFHISFHTDRGVSLPDSAFVCMPDSLMLTAEIFKSVLWNTSETTVSIFVKDSGTYSVEVETVNGCKYSDSTKVIVDEDCVWPGDANADGIVNNLDILAIGVKHGKTGPARLYDSGYWAPHHVLTWKDTLANGVDIKHTDCDGDGIINYLDTNIVSRNYSYTHNKAGGTVSGVSGDPVLAVSFTKSNYNPGDEVVVNVSFGDDQINAQDIYGLAFSLNRPDDLIEPGSISWDYSGSWLSGAGPALLVFNKWTGQGYRIESAISRVNQTNKSGSGTIATLRFHLKSSVSVDKMVIKFENVHIIDNNEIPVPFITKSDSVIFKTGVTGNDLRPAVLVYPNPANDLIYIDYGTLVVSSMILTDLNGKIIRQIEKPEGPKHTLNVEGLPQGIYLLQIKSQESIIVNRIGIGF
ncbi:MAG: T9SS type A sorting domain-containing protein [Bacteroidia bacterium]